MAHRIEQGVSRPAPVRISVDGEDVEATPGEMLATVLLGNGHHMFWRDLAGRARGPFCNMGVCYDCLVTVEIPGVPARRVRACLAPVVEHMRVRTGAAPAPGSGT